MNEAGFIDLLLTWSERTFLQHYLCRNQTKHGTDLDSTLPQPADQTKQNQPVNTQHQTLTKSV